jgi:hypothetical protein
LGAVEIWNQVEVLTPWLGLDDAILSFAVAQPPLVSRSLPS